MPYIKPEERPKFKKGLDNLMPNIENAGQLNYVLTNLFLGYLKHNGKNYQNINDIVGALTCAKDEFYRTIVGPYENTKIIENGDVIL